MRNSLMARPFSDLGLALSLGFFLPSGSAFTGQAALPILPGGCWFLSVSEVYLEMQEWEI